MTYIPNRDVDLLAWSLNFSTLLTADPNRYGVDASDALVIQGEYDDFAAAMAIVSSDDTRTPAAIAHKNGVKALLLADCRYFGQYIKSLRGVANEDKAALGLALPDPTPTPVPVPSTAPDFSIISATATQMNFRFRNIDTPTSNAKPPGVTQLLLYVHIGTTAVTDFETADVRLAALYTKTPAVWDVPAGSSGKIATFWAQWANRKGQLGPLNAATSFTCP